jgi:cell division protein FtsI/penicillin-binding protein 2
VEFYNPNDAVEYIKVAFVMSRYDAYVDATTGTYPSGSLMLYSSSYVFTTVTTFNQAVAITRGTGAG